MEDNDVECDLMNSGCLDQEVPVEKNINMWPTDSYCNILVENVITFCHCLKSLPETKVKRF